MPGSVEAPHRQASVGRFPLPNGSILEFAAWAPEMGAVERDGAAQDAAAGFVFAPSETLGAQRAARGALFVVVEGTTPDLAATLHAAIERELARDRGTASARLLRAVRAACLRVEARAMHRFELAGFGLTALLIDDAFACLTQLLPSQAYVFDREVMEAIPEVPMRGAGQVTSAAGRRWEVEIEMRRFAVRPQQTYVLCNSLAGEALSTSKILDVARLEVDEAVALLTAPGRSARGAPGGAVVIRTNVPPEPPPRARLHSLDSRRRLKQVAGGPGALLPRPRLEAWGRRDRGPRLGPVVGGSGRGANGRRGGSRRWLLGVPVAVVAAAVAATRYWPVARLAPGGQPAAAPAQEAPPAPPAALSGRDVWESPEPLRAMAVVAGLARVLDAEQHVTALPRSGPYVLPAATGGATPALLGLIARDTDALAVDAGRTLWRLPDGDEAPRSVALRNGALWLKPLAFAVYSGSLYVLDPGAANGGQIWRHAAGTGGGFDGESVAWLQTAGTVSLERATGLAVDGFIWVSRDDGAILKLAAGKPEPFEIKGLSAAIQNAAAIYTERTVESLYVLDGGARRLVRLTKEGQAQQEVAEVLPLGEHVRGLWVDEPAKRALILTNRRLREVPLP
jgi:hypothetical protein